MKYLLPFLLLTAPAFAQTAPTPGQTALVCAYNSSPPAPVAGQFYYVQCDATGKLITSGGGGGSPSGPAGGDLAGTYPNPTLANTSTARSNLGLGSAATQASTFFLQSANNLSDLASAATARTNLGLGTAATQNTGTSGATIPLLNGANTWAAAQSFGNNITVNGTTVLQGGKTSIGYAINGANFSADSYIGFSSNSGGTGGQQAPDTGISRSAAGVVAIGNGSAVGNTAGTLNFTTELRQKLASASGTAPGAGVVKIEVVAGTTGGTCKLQAYAGTSTTPTTILDNIGSGC